MTTMELAPFFRSVIDQDRAAVVLCDLSHTIIYMNPASISNYHKDLTGQSLLNCHNADSNEKIERVVRWFAADTSHNCVFTFHNEKQNKDVYMIALRDADGSLIGYYEKHEYRNPETAERYQLG